MADNTKWTLPKNGKAYDQLSIGILLVLGKCSVPNNGICLNAQRCFMARHKARFPNTTKNIFFPAFLEVCIEKLEGYGGATSMAVFHWCLACLWWLPSKPWSLTSSNMECKTDGFSTQSLAGFLLLGSWALAANSCLLVILGLVVEQLLLGCQWFGVLQDWQGDSLLAYSGKTPCWLLLHLHMV